VVIGRDPRSAVRATSWLCGSRIARAASTMKNARSCALQLVRLDTLMALLLLFIIGVAAQARAQTYISPFLGATVGGDSGCPEEILVIPAFCEEKHTNFGVAVGRLGSIFGVEGELGYAKDFFGTGFNISSSVLTLMANGMLVPHTDPIRPYVLVGLGLMKTHGALSADSALDSDVSQLGWDVGGGIFVFFDPNVGIRGDVRYFQSFQEAEETRYTFTREKLDFSRISGAFVLKW
jgi:opacity protein-like surface antigen